MRRGDPEAQTESHVVRGLRGAAGGSRWPCARHRPGDRRSAGRAGQPDPARDLSRQGQGRGDHRPRHRTRHRTGGDGLRAVADPAAQSREGLEHQGARPHRAHSGNLRPPRQDQGRLAAGRTGASELSAQPPGAVMDPSGAAARRFWLHGRSRRNPDRGRPPPDRRSHHPAGERNQESPGDAAAAPCRPAAGAVSRRRTGRLHQRRQIDAVQPADPRRRAGRRHAVRDA